MAKKKRIPNPLKRDPTRTTLLRRSFESDVRRRFKKLRKAIFDLIVIEDAFGIKEKPSSPFAANVRWEFATDPEKVKNFRKWFQEQIDEGLLETPAGTDPARPWTAKYTTSAYKRGIVRSYIETKGAALQAQTEFGAGSQAQFLSQSFGGPIGTKQIELLALRSFEGLRGISAQMSTDMSRILTSGLAHGHGPRKIAAELARSVSGIEKKRALTLARTEIIHSYAEGQLDSLEELGIEEVKAMAEWSTAGDDRVCPQCQPLEGTVMTIKEARGLIPRHPNCRCAWIPILDARRNNRKLNKAIEKSVKAEKPKAKSKKDALKQSKWEGADRHKPTLGKRKKKRKAAKT